MEAERGVCRPQIKRDSMDLILIAAFLNAGFAVILLRLSRWYKLKVEDYFYHMICLNAVIALLYVGKRFNTLVDYPISVRFFAALAIVYLLAEPFRKNLLGIIRSAISKLEN